MKGGPPLADKARVEPAPGGAPAAELEQVSFTYRDGERPALSALGFALKPGEMVGVMGASGAGKSTLAKSLNRLVPAFEDGEFRGVVRIGGRQLGDARVCEVAPLVGMVFQDFEAQLFSTNVAHEVAFAMEQTRMSREEMRRRIGPALKAVGLNGFEHRDPTSLSGGEKQRLAIAAVLALSPGVVVLDEPTTDLDPEGRAEVFALIRHLRGQGLALIVIEHEAEELRGCDRLVLVKEGAIAEEGPVAELMARIELLEDCGVHPPDLNRLMAMLGMRVHVRHIDEAEAMIRERFPRAGAGGTGLPADDPPAASPPAGPPAHGAGAAPPLVEGRHLSFAYPDGPRVLHSVDLTLMPGEFVAIVGRNGSGKTTLAKHLAGLLKSREGRVLVEGRDRAAMRPAEGAGLVGYVFQNPDHQIFGATVEEEVAFGPRNFGLDRAEIERRSSEVLDAVGLAGARGRDPFLLSKGERQRLAVAGVLALRPRLLILDEPTTGLDYREQRRMMALVEKLNRSGIAILMITHTPWLVAEYARRVVVMHRGRKLFDGPTRELMRADEVLEACSFRPPEVTRLSRRFGALALSAEEFAAWLERQC